MTITKEELKDRINARKHELQSKLSELKADSREESAKARDGISARLRELEDMLKDGWERISDATAAKLNSWLDRK